MSGSAALAYPEAVRRFKAKYLVQALAAEGGHMQRAAERMGVHRNTVTRIAHDAGFDAKQLKELACAMRREAREVKICS